MTNFILNKDSEVMEGVNRDGLLDITIPQKVVGHCVINPPKSGGVRAPRPYL